MLNILVIIDKDKHIYFGGLNGLRFFAALAVIITHTELIKNSFGLINKWKSPLFFNLGGMGVYFFFVLSGFLITFLLLNEKEKFGTISIKQFYIRRILRIWPLYYFILIVGFFILPQFDTFKISYLENSFELFFYPNLILYLAILPNLAFSLYPAVPNIGQAWSIGVEEQFYIFWPLLIAKSKSILKTLVLMTITLILIKIVILFLGYYYSGIGWYQSLKLYVAMSKFECMSIGGIGAYLLFQNHSILKFINHPITFLFSIFTIIFLIYFTPENIQDGIHLAYSFLFLQNILFVVNTNKQLSLDNRTLNYLGKISYGIYMYHLMIIPLCIHIYILYFKTQSLLFENIIIYTSVILLTLITSSLSYEFIEYRFIKLKNKFAVISSGNK